MSAIEAQVRITAIQVYIAKPVTTSNVSILKATRQGVNIIMVWWIYQQIISD